ncbi:MAG TPA: SufD family Fe-S cluster assembly protein [Hyphomonas sp.]|nr:SufD family Fe-S cluster assembly protein [Hyphomonas sp.]HRX73752.1 SufD family Fe-S cluster assembly protein [Hyphomonas sp.]
MSTALRDLIANPNAAELELVARYAMLPQDARRERAFEAFAKQGLPHRRIEGWRWTDIKAALPVIETPATITVADTLVTDGALIFSFTPNGFTWPDTLPDGLRVLAKPEAQAFGGSETMPLGALAAALSGGKTKPGTLMIEVTGTALPRLHFRFSGAGEANFARIQILLRDGASLEVSESYLGGAGFTASLLEYSLQNGARLNRTIYQRGTTAEVLAATASVQLDEGADFTQTVLAFGAKLARIETRVMHQQTGAKATLNAAYLCAAGHHADLTTEVRHGAPACVTRQVTKGAVLDAGRGVYQGKFLVPRNIGQKTDADMQHNALLLEEGAEVFAKPELEIYADDVECAHGNTSGALDANQFFYLRQRGIPEAEARALLTEAFIAEALEAAGDLEDVLREQARAWLAR